MEAAGWASSRQRNSRGVDLPFEVDAVVGTLRQKRRVVDYKRDAGMVFRLAGLDCVIHRAERVRASDRLHSSVDRSADASGHGATAASRPADRLFGGGETLAVIFPAGHDGSPLGSHRGRELRRIPLHGAEQRKIGLSDWNEGAVTAANEGQLVVWDATTDRTRHRIDMGKETIQTLALAAAGQVLATAIRTDQGAKVRLWDVASEKELRSSALEQAVYELAISADSNLLGSLKANQELHLWETATGKLLRTIPGAGRQNAFSPNGSKVASVVMDKREGVLKVWSVSEGKEVAVMPKVQRARHYSVCFSADSKLVASGGVRDVLLFDIASQNLLRRMPSVLRLLPAHRRIEIGLRVRVSESYFAEET